MKIPEEIARKLEHEEFCKRMEQRDEEKRKKEEACRRKQREVTKREDARLRAQGARVCDKCGMRQDHNTTETCEQHGCVGKV